MKLKKQFIVSLFILIFPVMILANPLAVVGEFIGGYLLGKGIDKIWDSVTNKPDIIKLNSRLKNMEINLRNMDNGLSNTIRDLRMKLDKNITKKEYILLAKSSMLIINKRIYELEIITKNNKKRIRNLEVNAIKMQKNIKYLNENIHQKNNDFNTNSFSDKKTVIRIKPRASGSIFHHAVTFRNTSNCIMNIVQVSKKWKSNGNFLKKIGLGLGGYSNKQQGIITYDMDFKVPPKSEKKATVFVMYTKKGFAGDILTNMESKIAQSACFKEFVMKSKFQSFVK